jgi:hypothetical protein
MDGAEDVVHLSLMGMNIVSVGRGYYIEAGSVGQRRQLGEKTIVPLRIVTMELNEETLGAEKAGIAAGHGQRLLPLLGQQQARDLPAATP